MTSPEHTHAVPSLADVVRSVAELPLHRGLGLELVDPSRPDLGVRLPVDDRTVNPSGVLHGGLVPLLLDVTSYLALLPRLAPGTAAVTVSSTCSLLAAVPPKGWVTGTATVERLGRTTAFLSARLAAGDDVVATAQVVKAVRSPR